MQLLLRLQSYIDSIHFTSRLAPYSRQIMEQANLFNTVNILSKRKKVIKEFFIRCESKRPISGVLMDLGCGDGGVTNLLSDLANNKELLVEGSDISPSMVDFAKTKYGSTGIQFSVFDIGGELPTDMVGRYDYVTSFFAFNWVHNQRKAVLNTHAMLKEDGDCLITMIAKATHFEAYRIMSKDPKWSSYMQDVEKRLSQYQDSEDPAAEFKAVMVDCGFSDVEVFCYPRLHDQGTMKSLRDLLHSFNPFVSRVPTDQQGLYMDEFMKIYLDCTGLYTNGRTKDGKVYYPYHFLKAFASK